MRLAYLLHHRECALRDSYRALCEWEKVHLTEYRALLLSAGDNMPPVDTWWPTLSASTCPWSPEPVPEPRHLPVVT